MKTKTAAVILAVIALATTAFAQSHLVNLSTRGYVGTGDYVLIAGCIIQGDQYKPTIVRAIGPSLTQRGVFGALSDPTIEIYDGNGTLLDFNDDWQAGANPDLIQNYGLAPSDNHESALYSNLPPGSYTLVVGGYDGATGVAVVEIYDLQP